MRVSMYSFNLFQKSYLCFGMRILSPFHLDTLIISIPNLKGLISAKLFHQNKLYTDFCGSGVTYTCTKNCNKQKLVYFTTMCKIFVPARFVSRGQTLFRLSSNCCWVLDFGRVVSQLGLVWCSSGAIRGMRQRSHGQVITQPHSPNSTKF